MAATFRWEDRGPKDDDGGFFDLGRERKAAEVSIMPMAGERELGMLVNIVRTSSGLKPVSDEELRRLSRTSMFPRAKPV